MEVEFLHYQSHQPVNTSWELMDVNYIINWKKSVISSLIRTIDDNESKFEKSELEILRNLIRTENASDIRIAYEIIKSK